jgi:dTDP-4-dehydrorhamnose reductase
MIFVAGKSGQVALSLTEAAKQRGIKLQCYGRPELDLSDRNSAQRIIETEKPSAIINAAAYTAVDQAETEEDLATAINADGPAMLAKVADGLGVPFLHISTDYVFDGLKNTPYVETDPVAPAGAYGRSKLAGEQAVMAANPNALIFRTAWVYSPFGKNFLKTMIALSARESLNVVNDQVGNPTYAPDIASALLDVLTQIKSQAPNATTAGLYHLSGTGDASWFDFARQIFSTAKPYGVPSPKVTGIPTSQYPTPAKRPANSRLNCNKLHEQFGIKLPSWQDSTSECVKRLSQTGGLV